MFCNISAIDLIRDVFRVGAVSSEYHYALVAAILLICMSVGVFFVNIRVDETRARQGSAMETIATFSILLVTVGLISYFRHALGLG